MTGKVLFGDDGSASADLAWMWINAQHWGDWTVDVLSATPDLGVGHAGPQPWEPQRPRVLLDPAAMAEVRHLRSWSDPRTALLEYPGKDLIVVGARGKGLFKAMHLGSTSQWLMHDPPAPLVIARRGLAVRNAVVCTDGSGSARAAAEAFAAMPWLPGVEVEVVAVEQVGLDAEAAVEETADLFAGRARDVASRVVAPDETEVFYHVRDILLAVLHSTSADLAVLGTRGLSGWRAVRAGSIATSLAAHAPCTVFMANDRLSSTATP